MNMNNGNIIKFDQFSGSLYYYGTNNMEKLILTIRLPIIILWVQYKVTSHTSKKRKIEGAHASRI